MSFCIQHSKLTHFFRVRSKNPRILTISTCHSVRALRFLSPTLPTLLKMHTITHTKLHLRVGDVLFKHILIICKGLLLDNLFKELLEILQYQFPRRSLGSTLWVTLCLHGYELWHFTMISDRVGKEENASFLFRLERAWLIAWNGLWSPGKDNDDY